MPGCGLDPQPAFGLIQNEILAEQIDADIVNPVVVEQTEQEGPPFKKGLDVFGLRPGEGTPAAGLREYFLGFALHDGRLVRGEGARDAQHGGHPDRDLVRLAEAAVDEHGDARRGRAGGFGGLGGVRR